MRVQPARADAQYPLHVIFNRCDRPTASRAPARSPITGAAIASLAPGGAVVSVGYSGGTTTQVNVTDLIWAARTGW